MPDPDGDSLVGGGHDLVEPHPELALVGLGAGQPAAPAAPPGHHHERFAAGQGHPAAPRLLAGIEPGQKPVDRPQQRDRMGPPGVVSPLEGRVGFVGAVLQELALEAAAEVAVLAQVPPQERQRLGGIADRETPAPLEDEILGGHGWVEAYPIGQAIASPPAHPD